MFQKIPENGSAPFCGEAFIIVYIDHLSIIQEPNEKDNTKAVPLLILCCQGMSDTYHFYLLVAAEDRILLM